jgi:hypothetical protein
MLLILLLLVNNFVCGSVWMWNLVSDIRGGTKTERVWEQGTEENIWTEERWSDRRMEKNCIMRSFITCTLRQI